MFNRKIILVPEKISIVLNSKISRIRYFGFGEIFSSNIFEPNFNNEKICIDLKILSSSDRIFKKNNSLTLTNNYYVNNDIIFFYKKFYFFCLKILIYHIDSNHIKVFVNRQYFKFIKLRIENIYPVGLHLSHLLYVKAIVNNDLVVYGASLYNIVKNNAFLIISPPAVGKSHTVLSLLNTGNYKYLGEDASYYDTTTNELFCVPFSSSFNKHNYFFSRFFKKRNIINIFSNNIVIKKAKLQRIYFFEKSVSNEIKKIDINKNILNKLLNIQRSATPYFSSQLLRTVDYLSGSINIEDLYQKEIILFEKMIQGKDIYLVLSNNYNNFYKIIDNNELNF